jgi:glycosyltransferase involved in cell wall biosynthesis
MKRLVFTVTNDLSYDQRMMRICSSLANSGYKVLLAGRKFSDSVPLNESSFKFKRIKCFFNKGPLGYAEFNIRLFFFLLFTRADLICAVDLDTIIPCFLVSGIKKTKRVYDAHELFCEMKEITTRPLIYQCWKTIEKMFVPHFQKGYTVNQPIADEFYRMYKVKYEVIRNMPTLMALPIPEKREKYILYQGAVNEGRGFETLIPAMKNVNVKLIICGDGNFMEQALQLVKLNNLEDKIVFKGKILPGALREYTLNAWIGITLFDKRGLSNYYSLANRFFDYMNAGVPQICVDYPVYRPIINEFPFAVLINDIGAESLAHEINNLLSDQLRYNYLQQNCLKARHELNWEREEKVLLHFYKKIFDTGA